MLTPIIVLVAIIIIYFVINVGMYEWLRIQWKDCGFTDEEFDAIISDHWRSKFFGVTVRKFFKR